MNPLISCVSSHAATSEKKTVTLRGYKGWGKRERKSKKKRMSISILS